MSPKSVSSGLKLAVLRTSLKMDKIVDGVDDALKTSGGSFKDEFLKAQKNILGKFPTPEHLKQLIDKLKDLTEEDKENLMKNIGERAQHAEQFKELLTNKNKLGANYLDYVVFIVVVLLIIAVFGESILIVISTVYFKGHVSPRNDRKAQK